MSDMRYAGGAFAICAVLWLVACGGNAHDPAAMADRITRAVYADNLDATIATFDDATKKVVTRSELGDLSDQMHALGEYKSLKPRSANADTGRYEYDAAFTKGSMLVQIRIDPSGKVGAYRVSPEGAPSSSATSS